jgi:hypothetical protein
MTTASAAPLVKPDVTFIEDLLTEIGEGRLRVPRFQRAYVWKPADMLGLLDSIRRGFPIGSLLLWETTTPAESHGTFGPLTVPAASGPTAYVLDGHQRLATLDGTLRLPKKFAPKEDDDWRWVIWYDLKTGEFTHLPKGSPAPHHLPVRALLRTMDFLQESQRIREQLPSEASALISEAEKVAQVVKSYRIAITRIRGGDLSQAVEIFSRLNARGQHMTPDQMVSALTYREGQSGVHLGRRIDDILEQLGAFHFGDVRRVTIFRAIVATANMDIHRSDWSELSKKLGTKLPDRIDAAEKGLLQAARFLNDELGVPGDKLLPYSHQLVLMSEFFHRCPNPDDHQRATLKRMFWSTSFTGWFAGANTTQISEALTEIRQLAVAPGTDLPSLRLSDPARPLPLAFDMRSARIRAFLLYSLTLAPKGTDGAPLDPVPLIWGQPTVPHVYPRAAGEWVSSPANRILLIAQKGVSIRDQLLGISGSHRANTLASHALDESLLAKLAANDGSGFVSERAHRLIELESVFMAKQGVKLPTAPTTTEPLLDTDGDASTNEGADP